MRGAIVERDGRRYQVWSDGPYEESWWAVPVERTTADPECVLLIGHSVHPHHRDGSTCHLDACTHPRHAA